MSIEGVKVILDSDALMVGYEEEVFQILLDWIDANCRTADEKQFAVEEVAGVIRFPWMTGDYLIDVVSTNPQMLSPVCQVEINSIASAHAFVGHEYALTCADSSRLLVAGSQCWMQLL